MVLDLRAIGNNIKKYRKGKGFTQAQLAEMIDISTIHMSHMETGSVSMSLECLMKICDSLDITPDDLLLGEYKLNSKSATKQLSSIMENLTADERKLIIDFAESLEKNKINKT